MLLAQVPMTVAMLVAKVLMAGLMLLAQSLVRGLMLRLPLPARDAIIPLFAQIAMHRFVLPP